MDTRRKNQLFLYLDIVLLGVGAVALVALVHDAFHAGHASTAVQGSSAYFTRAAFEAALVITATLYFLARFYKARIKDLANPWS